MHELSLCQSVVEIVLEQAAQAGARRVTGVWLEIGALACVEENALRFSFASVCAQTAAQGCALHLIHRPAQAWCWTCSARVEVQRHDARCPCCHSACLSVEGGEALRVKSIEIE